MINTGDKSLTTTGVREGHGHARGWCDLDASTPQGAGYQIPKRQYESISIVYRSYTFFSHLKLFRFISLNFKTEYMTIVCLV